MIFSWFWVKKKNQTFPYILWGKIFLNYSWLSENSCSSWKMKPLGVIKFISKIEKKKLFLIFKSFLLFSKIILSSFLRVFEWKKKFEIFLIYYGGKYFWIILDLVKFHIFSILSIFLRFFAKPSFFYIMIII